MALNMRTPRKLAIFFTSIPREKSIAVMKHFSIRSMELIAAEIRNLKDIDKETRDAVFNEISEKLAGGIAPTGGEDVALTLLAGAIGEDEAKKVLERAKPKKPKPFSTLSNVQGQDLATILSKEQASTASIILGFFSSKRTAEVLSFLDEGIRSEIVMHLAKNRDVDSDIVEKIEEVFIKKVAVSIDKNEDEVYSKQGGPEFIADIFQAIDRELEDELMGALQEESADIAEKIRDLMFTFEDILKFEDSEIQKILREVPMEKLVIALRGAPKNLFDKFANNLSKRAKENMQEEMDLMGKVKKSEIEAERKGIVGVIRALEASGDLSIASGEDGDEYV